MNRSRSILIMGLIPSLLVLGSIARGQEVKFLYPFCQFKAGFIGSNGEIVIPFTFDNVGDFSEGLAWAERKEKFGFIDKHGQTVIDFIFDAAGNFQEGLAAVKVQEKWGFIDKKGTLVITPQFSSLERFSEGLAPARDGEKWGFINEKGEWAIKPQFYLVGPFKEGLASVTDHEFTYRFIDKNGSVIIPQIDDISDYPPVFHNGYAHFHRCGGAPSFCPEVYIDKTGKTIFVKTIQHTYQEVIGESTEPIEEIRVNSFRNKNQWALPSEGLALIKENNKFGFCDDDGQVVIKAAFEQADDFSNGLARVKSSGRWGFIDKKGNWKIKPEYSEAENFYKDFAYVEKGTSTGFVDTKGRYNNIPYLSKYNNSKHFHEGLLAIRSSAIGGFIDSAGKVVIPPQFEEVTHFSEGIGLAKKNSKIFWIDSSGAILASKEIGPICTSLGWTFYDYHEGLRLVSCKCENALRYGYLDITGKMIVPPKFSRASNFSEGLAAVCNDEGKWGYIDPTGKEVIPYQFCSAKDFRNGKAVVSSGSCRHNEEQLLIDKSGKIIEKLDKTIPDIPCSDCLTPTHMKDRKYDESIGYTDPKGNWIISPQFWEGSAFSEGLAVVKTKDKKYGFIDPSGKFIIPPTYLYASSFYGGLAVVRPNSITRQYINKTGQVIFTYYTPENSYFPW